MYLDRDEYPQKMVDVYDNLIRFSGHFNSVGERYQQNPTSKKGRGGGKNRGEEVRSTQAETGGALAGTDGVMHAKIICYN